MGDEEQKCGYEWYEENHEQQFQKMTTMKRFAAV